MRIKHILYTICAIAFAKDTPALDEHTVGVTDETQVAPAVVEDNDTLGLKLKYKNQAEVISDEDETTHQISLMDVKLGDSVEDPFKWFRNRVEQNNYAFQNHTALTEDGYRINLFRITDPKWEGDSYNVSRPVILLQHGELDSADAWIIHPKDSIAFTLVKQGFDVWLGNSRGNKYSLDHKDYDHKTSQKYWEFSFVEMGKFDLPAAIQLVKSISGRSRISYVGHSEGAAQMVYALTISDRKDWWFHQIVSFTALAPLTRISPSPLKLFKEFSEKVKDIEDTCIDVKNNIWSIGGPFERAKTDEANFCQKYEEICKSAQTELVNDDKDIGLDDEESFSWYQQRFPSGTSTQNLIHYAQIHKTGIFQLYDYGESKNYMLYNSTTPPQIDISKIQEVPVFIWSSIDDKISSITDNIWFRNEIQIARKDGPANQRRNYIQGDAFFQFNENKGNCVPIDDQQDNQYKVIDPPNSELYCRLMCGKDLSCRAFQFTTKTETNKENKEVEINKCYHFIGLVGQMKGTGIGDNVCQLKHNGGHISFFIAKEMSWVRQLASDLLWINTPHPPEFYSEMESARSIAMLRVIISIISLVAVLYVGFLIIKLTKCKNLRLALLVIFMNLTFIFDLWNELILIKMFDNMLKDPFYNGYDDPAQKMHYNLNEIKDVLFMIMIMVNLNNWAFYTILIQEQTGIKNTKLGAGTGEDFDKKKKTMNIVSFAVSSFIFIVMIIAALYGNTDENRTGTEITLFFVFSILGLAFLYLGLKITGELEKSFVSFYWRYRGKLIIATLLLSIPLMTYAVLIIIRVINGEFRVSITNSAAYSGGAMYNLIIFLISFFIPIWTQLASLVFGFIRKSASKKASKKKSLESKPAKDEAPGSGLSTNNINTGAAPIEPEKEEEEDSDDSDQEYQRFGSMNSDNAYEYFHPPMFEDLEEDKSDNSNIDFEEPSPRPQQRNLSANFVEGQIAQ